MVRTGPPSHSLPGSRARLGILYDQSVSPSEVNFSLKINYCKEKKVNM